MLNSSIHIIPPLIHGWLIFYYELFWYAYFPHLCFPLHVWMFNNKESNKRKKNWSNDACCEVFFVVLFFGIGFVFIYNLQAVGPSTTIWHVALNRLNGNEFLRGSPPGNKISFSPIHWSIVFNKNYFICIFVNWI